jgi:hypothetical protein
MTTTPAMACTDWKAVAAFDAILNANDTRELTTSSNSKIEEDMREKALQITAHIASRHMGEVEQHRDSALRDNCRPE